MPEITDKKAVEQELKKRKTRRKQITQKEERLLREIEKVKSEIGNFEALQKEVTGDLQVQLSKVEEDFEEIAIFVSDEEVNIAKLEDSITKFIALTKALKAQVLKKKESIVDHQQYLPGHEKNMKKLKIKIVEAESLNAPKLTSLRKDLEKYERRLASHRSNNTGLLSKPQAS